MKESDPQSESSAQKDKKIIFLRIVENDVLS